MPNMSSALRTPALPAARPPRALSLVRDPLPEEIGAPIDWSAWHLTDEDDVGQSPEQDHVVRTVASALEERFRELRRDEQWIGVDAFFAWVREAPLVRVSPDVYTLAAHPGEPLPKSFQTGLPGRTPPIFALEIVSDEWKEDYDDGPQKYALLGASELVVFDADAARGDARPPRVPFQVFRRTADGAFVQAHRGAGPVRAETIDSWLVATATHDTNRLLRLARDAAGADLVPTSRERADAEAQRADDGNRRADEEKRRADEEKRRADEEKRRADEEKHRADALAAELDALRNR